MFETHQKKIGEFAQANPENMARVYQFVLATIQQGLDQTPDIMKDVDLLGADSRYLFGFKSSAWEYSQEHKQAIFNITTGIYAEAKTPEDAAHGLLMYFAGLPGLGVVKGGFMVQCCFGLSGCIDSHNLTRFGLKGNTFSSARFKNTKNMELKAKIVRDYHGIVAKIGGSKGLWDSWCDYVAERQNRTYGSGYDVSALHVTAILPQ